MLLQSPPKPRRTLGLAGHAEALAEMKARIGGKREMVSTESEALERIGKRNSIPIEGESGAYFEWVRPLLKTVVDQILATSVEGRPADGAADTS
jgi:hypothetical protein